MTQDNNNALHKEAVGSGKANRNNNYNRYKKSSISAKSDNTKTEIRKTVQKTTKTTEKTDAGISEKTGTKSNFNKNRNFKKKIYNSKRPRYSRNPADESVDEIKTDIRRIEKEIRLEIEEIKSLKV